MPRGLVGAPVERISVQRAMLAASVVACMSVGSADAQPIHDRIYQPSKLDLNLADLPAGSATINVVTADGLTLTGIDVPGRSDRPLVLIFHGNGSGADATAKWFAPLASRGYGLIVAEYRGYATNPGRPDEAGLAKDADAFYAYAKERANGRPVIVIGHSLGGGVAFGLATRQRLDALIAIATFTRLRDMAPKIARAFVQERYDNLAAVATLDEPWFLLHGTADEIVPAGMANKLHNAAVNARRRGASYVLTGATHHPDGTLLADVIDAVVAQLLGHTPTPLPPSVKSFPFGG